MNNVFGSRLRKLRKDKRMTMKELGVLFGLAESTISGYETGIRNPDLDFICKIAEYFTVTTDYLMGIEDESPIDNTSKKSDNSTYTRQSGNGFIAGSLGELFDPGEMVYVPIVADVSCGQPAFTEDGVIGYLPILTAIFPISNRDEYFAIRAKGDSMIDADIKDGSFVLIHKQPAVENGDIAAVCVRSENATLKRVHVLDDKVVLSPANPKYAPQTYPLEDIRIVGKAIMVTKAL